MERKFQFSIDEFYHLYNRGVNKMSIFSDNSDKDRFIKLLFVCNGTNPVVFKTIQGLPLDKIEKGETIVDIGAYCLMPNHFHLLIKEKKENGISIFMEKLLTAYSMYFNKKYERTGSLFEGTFRATHADQDEYLKYLFAYIHLNPLKLIYPDWKEKGISDIIEANNFLKTYKYSSLFDYMGFNRIEFLILNKEKFPEYFSDFKEFHDYIDYWLKSKIQGLPLEKVNES
ncbi:MAG: transposase [Candidatus Terrybacteria bacterium]|nr:transposase [Candidatus Terrybacteria bacterium]